MAYNQEQLTTYLKNYGFIFASSEIYNGLANAWDYGPLGAMLKDNLQHAWLDYFVRLRPNTYRLDSSIILNPAVWKASGHLANFSDPLIDCKQCHNRFRADKLLANNGHYEINENVALNVIDATVKQAQLKCPVCHHSDWTPTRKFNLMFKTFQGVTEETANVLYLRPETAQGIYINIRNIMRTTRARLPFAVAQVGKAFRNEITPGNFIFRTREFEHCEYELFVHPEGSDQAFNDELTAMRHFLVDRIGLNEKNIRTHEHPKNELAHYSKRTVDYEFAFPHGFSELWGLAHRGDYDLSVHEAASKKDLHYTDPTTGQKLLPHVVEHSIGLGRLFYALIANAYTVETLPDEQTREVLKLRADLAPYPVAVYPLATKLDEQTKAVYHRLIQAGYTVLYDSSGSVGKRYRRGDAIGVKYAVTFDFDSVNDHQVTIRERDMMQQVRIPIATLVDWLKTNGVPFVSTSKF